VFLMSQRAMSAAEVINIFQCRTLYLQKKKSSGSGTGSIQPREYN
jgi:hypothetical protein